MLSVSLLLLAGCNSPEWAEQRRSTMNTWAIDQYYNDQVDAGIVSQRTLYPYHFVSDSADLNELGQRDLAVLAGHFRDNPGSMNVRQGAVHGELYQARLATVTEGLSGMGVDAARVRLADGYAGGEGLSSARTIHILEEKMDAPFTLETTELSTISSDN